MMHTYGIVFFGDKSPLVLEYTDLIQRDEEFKKHIETRNGRFHVYGNDYHTAKKIMIEQTINLRG